jgi:hypothetical protein
MNPADIAEALHSYCIAPSPGLRAEHIVTPQPGLVAEVLALFLANFVGYAFAPAPHSCPRITLTWVCFGGAGILLAAATTSPTSS